MANGPKWRELEAWPRSSDITPASMKDSNDGSDGVRPEAPASEPVASIPVSVAVTATADEGARLPPVPPGVMKPAAAAKTGTAGVSLVPSTEPSVELAARASAAAPPPAADATGAADAADADPVEAEQAPASAPPPSEAPESAPSVLQVLAPHLSEEQVAARRKDKLRGLVIIGVTFVACVLVSVWGKEKAEPEESLPPRPPTTEGLTGWPDKVDPFAAVALARRVGQRDLLRGIVAEHVASDGTVDFKQAGGTVRYSFQSEPGHGPQPPRDPGKIPPRSYCGKQNVHIRRHGLVADPDVPAFPCPAKPRESLPDPQCSTKQIWDFALSREVPAKKPARIEYYAARSGPAYRITVSGTHQRLTLAADCKTELKNPEALGGVP